MTRPTHAGCPRSTHLTSSQRWLAAAPCTGTFGGSLPRSRSSTWDKARLRSPGSSWPPSLSPEAETYQSNPQAPPLPPPGPPSRRPSKLSGLLSSGLCQTFKRQLLPSTLAHKPEGQGGWRPSATAAVCPPSPVCQSSVTPKRQALLSSSSTCDAA